MAGLTALQLAVPAADALLARLRPLLPAGCTVLDPAHISLGHPWLTPERARAAVPAVTAALAQLPPLAVTLTGPHHFAPDHRGRVVLWLAPEPDDGVRLLGAAIAAVAGLPGDFLPHCSLVRLAQGVDRDPFARIAADATPLRTTLDTVDLHVQRCGGWHHARSLALTGAPDTPGTSSAPDASTGRHA